MGDRGNIYVIEKHDQPGIFLYTHWGGSSVREVVQHALAKKWRWDDAPYLTRIIYDVLVGSSFGSETGFGISTTICDNEHPIVVVDVPEQRIGMMTEYYSGLGGSPSWHITKYIVKWTPFKKYIHLPVSELYTLHLPKAAPVEQPKTDGAWS